MKPKPRTHTFAATVAIFLFVPATFAQDQPTDPDAVPLTVPAGAPLHVTLVNKIPIKQAGLPIEGRVVDPVYVFDRVVIPAGSEVRGRVAKVESARRKQRALAIANGNFTPLRKAQLEFNTLVLKDGKEVPLQTAVSPGAPNVVHLSAGGGKKQGRVGSAVTQAREQAKQREQKTIEAVKAPGKMQRLKAMIIAELPYHRLVIPAGTHFTAELKSPLELGTGNCPPKELEQLGTEIPRGSVVHVRLVTALSSSSDHRGSKVEALVSEPVFSPDHQLILPEGAHLDGMVTQAVPARRLGRNGQLRFTFQEIQLPQGTPRKVEASLQALDVPGGATHLELDSEGGAHAVTPKKQYIAPAIDVLLATSSLDGLDHHHHHIDAGSQDTGNAIGGGVRGGAGFGLVGTVIGLAAHYRPLSAGFAFYGASRSVYSHVVARGNDVVFPKNTPMDIRFGTHEGEKLPEGKGKSFASQGTAPVKPT